MFTPKRLNRKTSRLGIGSPATPMRGTPGTPGREATTTVPIKIFELLKENIQCNIIAGGYGLAIYNESIWLWRLQNKQNLYTLPVPAGYTCKPQNVVVVGTSVCFISTTGTGRFWQSMDKPTLWFEFKIHLDSGDFINHVHADASRIGAVTNKGALFNVYVQNSVVKYTTHKIPDSRGLVLRVSSIFWSGATPEEEKHSVSTLISGVFVICVNQTIYGWDVHANSSVCKFIIPYSHVFGDALLESISGNDKYIGFLLNGSNLSYLIGTFDDFAANPKTALEQKPVKFAASSPLKLTMPYLSQVAITSSNQVWLNNSNIECEDNIMASGSFDGNLAIITYRGLRFYKTSQKISSNLSESIIDIKSNIIVNNIEALEQLSQSDIPKDRLQAAFIQFNQGNHAEAEELLQTIGNLECASADISRDIIDEIPSHDPRWNRGVTKPTGNQSLLIQKQIQEKICKHNLFITFLSSRLSSDALVSLSQDGEKLLIASLLRHSPQTLQSQLDQAIHIVICQRNQNVQAGLTHQDYFYQKISQVDTIIPTLASFIENTIINSKDRTGKISYEIIEIIQKINALVCLVIHGCNEFRTKYELVDGCRNWSTVLQDSLIQIIKLNGDNDLHGMQPAIIDQLFRIAKFVLRDRLDIYQNQSSAAILDENSDFGKLRAQILKIFVDSKHISEAGLLGEEFHDFNTLVRVYEIEQDEARLGSYLNLDKFPEYLFNKYRGDQLVTIAAKHGGKIAEIVRNDAQHGWLLSLKEKRYDQATDKLVEQALERDISLSKRTLLSIAKLSSIAQGNLGKVDEIKSHEVLLDYQDKLPDSSLHVSKKTSVLDGYDIIDHMTNGNVASMSIDNAKNALEVMRYIEDDREEMKTLIWSRLIQSEMDSQIWKDAINNSHHPTEALKGSKFSQLLSLADEDQLPNASDLSKQSDFADNPVFSFITGAAVEARYEAFGSNMAM